MKLTHKIKLILCRVNWWLGFTKRAKRYAERTREYSLLEKTFIDKQDKYNEAFRKNPSSDLAKTLLIEIKLLGSLLK